MLFSLSEWLNMFHIISISWKTSWQEKLVYILTFSGKGWIVNIFGFAGHTVCVRITQLGHYGVKAAIDDI